MWLARICQFGLAAPSLVLPREFRRLRVLSRHRRRTIDDCARLRNRKILDRDGIRIGGVLVFGVNRMRILRGMIDEDPRDVASRHVAAKRDTLEEVLAYDLNPYSRQILGDLLDCHDHANQKIAYYDNREDLDGFEKQLLLDDPRDRQGVDLRHPSLAPTSACRHPLRCLGGRLSRQRQKCRQATQRTKRQPDAAQGRVCARRRTNRQLSVPRQALAAERAIVATAHKLLRVVYCVPGKPYRDPDYEEMMVKRNAPRWIRMLEIHHRMTKAACSSHGEHGRYRQPERRTVPGSSSAARRQGVTGQPSAS